jgi:NADH/NAD ratio-sensing transcriptional regulator Rex
VDFELSPEQRLIQDTVRAFVDERVLPNAIENDIEHRLDMGVIATPVRAAQEVADLLVKAGVRGILNFAPRKLFVPAAVTLRNVDMTVELESLSFALAQRRRVRRRAVRD